MLEYLIERVGEKKTYEILSYYLDKPISEIKYRVNFDIPKVDIDNILKALEAGKPLNKIFGYEYFYGEKFFIDENVLAPRSDTECVVECALKNIKMGDSVLDLCTGSGCIGITLEKNANISLTMSDYSDKALRVAGKNLQYHKINAKLIKSNMFDALDEKYDLIVSNPPYIESNVVGTLDIGVREFDPLMALDGGEDGLDFYRIIRKEFENYLKPNGVLVLEIGYNQAKPICELFSKFNVEIYKDYGGHDRVAVIKR